jgi:hypothetical protein
MSNMEGMRTEQNSFGLLEGPSDELLGDANSGHGNVLNPRPGRL